MKCSRNRSSTASAMCLERALSPEEVQYFAEMTRRIGAILLVSDRAYRRNETNAYGIF